jgi:hypothetical protein
MQLSCPRMVKRMWRYGQLGLFGRGEGGGAWGRLKVPEKMFMHVCAHSKSVLLHAQGVCSTLPLQAKASIDLATLFRFYTNLFWNLYLSPKSYWPSKDRVAQFRKQLNMHAAVQSLHTTHG